MRPELLDPVTDPEKLEALIPLTSKVLELHEAGRKYEDVLADIARLTGRIVSRYEVAAAFGGSDGMGFARGLLVDWEGIPADLSRQELLEAMVMVCTDASDPIRTSYLIKCLALNTGDDQISDLIYWPDQYRGGKYEGQELEPEKILEIALRSGRKDAEFDSPNPAGV